MDQLLGERIWSEIKLRSKRSGAVCVSLLLLFGCHGPCGQSDAVSQMFCRRLMPCLRHPYALTVNFRSASDTWGAAMYVIPYAAMYAIMHGNNANMRSNASNTVCDDVCNVVSG